MTLRLISTQSSTANILSDLLHLEPFPEKFGKHIEDSLKRIEPSCSVLKHKPITIAKRVRRLLGRYSRAAGLFRTDVIQDTSGRVRLVCKKSEAWRDWASLSEAC